MPERKRLRDAAARDLMEARLDLNLLVEAGAGSGKTESLARRMAAGIAAGAYEIEGMAAVTFTRKAAAELRGRFQIALEKRLAEETGTARQDRIRQALSRLERLFAGTIHAFCAHLLRERPVEAGVAPGFTELDETADQEQRERAWRLYLDRERAAGSPTLRDLLDAGVRPPDLDGAFRIVCTYAEIEFPPGEGTAPDPAPAWQALDRFWTALNGCLPGPIEPETTCPIQQTMQGFSGRLRVADRSRPGGLADLLADWEGGFKATQKWWHPDPKQKKAAAEKVATLVQRFQVETVTPFLANWRQYVYRLAMTLLCGGREFAAQARARAVALNYGDLLERAAHLLREKPEVRTALQQKYRWLFVDEFQDTDPIQAEVIFFLAAAGAAERDWTRVPLRPGALFIVGDPKQSIYRFRRADIDTYTRVRQLIEDSGGQVIPLTTSFRADPALCTWGNGVFPNFFPDTATQEQPAFGGLDPDPNRAKGDPATTGLRILDIPGTGPRADMVLAEAKAIARFIHKAVLGGKGQWGDFLILTRKKQQLPVYARALEALQVPVEVSGGAAFAESPGVRVLANLLQALSDAGDATALVGVLRGALFGLSDEALFRHRDVGLSLLLTAPLPEGATGPVAEALRALQAMFRWTRSLPAPAAVERALEETGLLAKAATATLGGGATGNLLHAVDRVRQITETGGSLADAALALEEDIESTDIDAVPLEPGRRNVVRIMNLHKAKGLEASTVFLADPLGGVKARADARILRDGIRAVGFLPITRPVGDWRRKLLAVPKGWAEHEAAELAYVTAEEHRLLYVAATRAKELLVISRYGSAGGRATCPWEPLAPYLKDATLLAIPGAVAAPPAQVGDLGPQARMAAQTAREEGLRQAATPSWRVESVTGTAHRGARPAQPPEAGHSREPDTGMAWGHLVHALLEQALRGPHCDRAHLERLARWFTVEQAELQPVIPEALDTEERVMASDLWRRAMAAEERLVEVPFAVKVSNGDGPPSILHGVIDLAFRSADGWGLVDYKTDQVDAVTLVALYGNQVRQYAKQWAALTGAPVKYAGLFSVRAGQCTRNLIEE